MVAGPVGWCLAITGAVVDGDQGVLKRGNPWFAGLAGTALALAMAVTVLAYAEQVAGSITVAGPGGTIRCGVPITVRATVVDATSTAIDGQPVAWSYSSSPSSADALDPPQSITNASGAATTTVTLANVAGNRTVTATADAISAGAVLVVICGGLPGTSTEAADFPAEAIPMLTILAALIGGGIAARRFAPGR
jgi:hypothetical protein